MHITNLDLNLLVVFDTLYQEQNVTRAAERLALTQPTVSGMIKRLRYTFKDKLFVRTSHGMIPTSRADELAGPIKELLNGIEELISPQPFIPNESTRTFHICCNDYMQTVIIRPLIRKLRVVAPSVKISIVPVLSFDIKDRLGRGEIDLYLTTRTLAIKSFEIQPLYIDKYICVAGIDHPFNETFIPTETICSYEHIIVSPSGEGLTGPIDLVLEGYGYTRNVSIGLPTFSALFEVLQSSNFLTFMPRRLLAAAHPRIKFFNTELKMPKIEVVANWHQRFDGDLAHQWLRNVIADIIA